MQNIITESAPYTDSSEHLTTGHSHAHIEATHAVYVGSTPGFETQPGNLGFCRDSPVKLQSNFTLERASALNRSCSVRGEARGHAGAPLLLSRLLSAGYGWFCVVFCVGLGKGRRPAASLSALACSKQPATASGAMGLWGNDRQNKSQASIKLDLMILFNVI